MKITHIRSCMSFPSIFGLFLGIGGILLAFYGKALGLMQSGMPGPGLWPVFIGSGMLFCGLSLAFSKRNVPASEKVQQLSCGQGPVLSFIVAIFFWICLLNILGWALASFISIHIARGGAGATRFQTSLLAIGVIVLLYLGLDVIMNRPLPTGSLWSLS